MQIPLNRRNKKIVRIVGIVGARPNFMKIDPILRQLEREKHEFDTILVHTGQHYDDSMSRVFFTELGIRRPDFHLDVGSGSHAAQTANVMIRLEPILQDQWPDLVLVVGDVNSTMAAALTAGKLNIPVAHVEAGLRSHDRMMPEEINRVVTDALSTILFTTSRDAAENLEREGIPAERIFFVGNVMIDTLMRCKSVTEDTRILTRLAIERKGYVLVTLHRPGNVDDKEILEGIVDALIQIAERTTVVFPVHPRTAFRLRESGFEERLKSSQKVVLLPALGYLDFLVLEANASIVLTDSGGIQEETTVLGVPCLTLRENTERPVTVQYGTNKLIGHDRDRIVNEVYNGLIEQRNGLIPELWDGNSAERIVDVIRNAYRG